MRIFTNEVQIEILVSGTPIHQYEKSLKQEKCTFKKFISLYENIRDNKHNGIEQVFCFSDDPKKLIKKIKEHFKIIFAAGGIVTKDNDVLFIYRLGKWDLPKGKIEKGEDIETAALREVEEECGVDAELNNKIGVTWHTYQYKDKDILKCTYWFAMNNLDDSEITPQIEEDILEVKWVNKNNVRETVLTNSYNSIIDIYNLYEQTI